VYLSSHQYFFLSILDEICKIDFYRKIQYFYIKKKYLYNYLKYILVKLSLNMDPKNCSVFILEDESVQLELLKVLLKDLGYTDVKTAQNYDQALEVLDHSFPNIALLDINLQTDKSGLDVAREIAKIKNIPLIFLTSNFFEDVYEEAKKVGPVSFLNKDLSSLKLKQAIELALLGKPDKELSIPKQPENTAVKTSSIFIRSGNNLKKVKISDISFAETEGRYINIYTKTGQKHVSHLSLKDLKELLPAQQFVRIHQSTIVNHEMIDSINTNENFILIQGKQLSIGRSYRKNLINRLKII